MGETEFCAAKKVWGVLWGPLNLTKPLGGRGLVRGQGTKASWEVVFDLHLDE